MRGIFISLIMAVVAVTAAGAQDAPTEPAYTYSAQVLRVIDGETIEADIDLGFFVWLREQRLGLYGVDAPDADEAADKAQAATEYLRGEIEGKQVILETFVGPEGGVPWLARIFVDGKDVNQGMVDAGHAVPRQ